MLGCFDIANRISFQIFQTFDIVRCLLSMKVPTLLPKIQICLRFYLVFVQTFSEIKVESVHFIDSRL